MTDSLACRSRRRTIRAGHSGLNDRSRSPRIEAADTYFPAQPDGELIAAIGSLIADLPTYGYRGVHALLRRQTVATGRAALNPKRVCRVMKLHGLLLQRAGRRGEQHRHDGRVAVDVSNTRWCSDGLEIACDNGEKVRVAFALDCCDREAIGYVGDHRPDQRWDFRDLMTLSVEHRFGQVNALSDVIRRLC